MSAGSPSAVTWLARLRAGELSARDLVARTLERIDAADTVVHAVTASDPEAALRAADAADAARRGGDERPLLGLPVTVKDCLDVAGLPTLSGTLARRGHVATADATVVARLRAAGAIPVAKTNVPELCSSFETDNLVHGRTNHPLDPERTPGGSSGGEAAVLGADASIVGIGTDGGGSIRVPAHYVGIVGLRPTVGRTPETGAWPDTRATGTADLTCVGPMARHVEDLALLLPVIAGADDVDPFAVDVALGDPRRVAFRGLRVGVLLDHPHAAPITDGVRAAVERAARTLEQQGAAVVPIDASALAGDGPSATELFFAAAGADGGAAMRAATADAHGHHHPQFAALLAAAAADDPPTAADYFAVRERLHRFRAHVRARFATIDALLAPVVSGPAPRHGEPPARVPAARYLDYAAFEHAHLVAVAGLPSCAVPVATEDGLPVGVQVAAAPFREDVALAVAGALEAAHGGFAINRTLAERSPIPTRGS